MRKNVGFTLLEIMVAMMILTLGMVGVLGMLLTSSGIGQQSIDTTEASLLMDAVLTDLAVNYSLKYYLAQGETSGYPLEYLKANDGAIPDNPFYAKIPDGWAGTSGDINFPGTEDNRIGTNTGLLKNGYTYTIYYVPLPNTQNFITKNPQCMLAEVTVYWIRQGRVFEMTGEQIIYTGN